MRGLLLALVLLLPGAAGATESALDLLDTAQPYSADFTLAGSRGTYHGKVWHTRGRERRDVQTEGGGQGVLILRDQDLAYLLGLSGKWYVGLSLKAAAAFAGGLDGWSVTRAKTGDETVAGVRATRWKTSAQGPKGGFTGDIWTSRDGIVLRARGVVDNPDGDDAPVEMSLSNLKLGAVDARMLEVPQGWFGFDLKGVPADKVEQAVEGLKPLLSRRK
jgi:hypothetical protein